MTSLWLASLCLAGAMTDTAVVLNDVTVTGNGQRDYQMRSSQTSVRISREFMEQNFAGSLMQTLQHMPGVKAISIGSGQSKPTIRGLGSNRLAVTEDGIKHEGQQWGDDHGLEIDQFAVDRSEIIKGPAALLYGSDAIGGVLRLYSNHIPTERIEGAVQLFGRTNNGQVGMSAKVGGLLGHFFYRAHVTMLDYGDYRVPTDSIQYYSYWIQLKDQRLRNTAGHERDGSVMVGYAGYNFHTDLRVSESYSKSGFFANAHGLEVRLSNIDYDHSSRDIDLPYQSVNHLKVHSHTSWRSGGMGMEADLAYQNNYRQELSEPTSHGYMPKPDDSRERIFDKSTYTANLSMRLTWGEGHTLQSGVNEEYQHNRRRGWGFIIPDFENNSLGAYLADRYEIRPDLIINAGVRYDHVHSHIHDYTDWYQTPVDGVMQYKQRSQQMHRYFNSLTWSAGINYSHRDWVVKANLGKSFRVPIPKELGADGINYHIFRYERGNADLDPEESYQLDVAFQWDNGKMSVHVDPYLNYFPNYIYLNPTSDYVEGLQLYHYTQAEVLRYGWEAQWAYCLNRHWSTQVQGEYLMSRQQSGDKRGYTLPFSTPWSVDTEVKYKCCIGRHVKDDEPAAFVALNIHVVGRQDEIVPPEKPTDGYWTLNVSAGHRFTLGRYQLQAALHVDNLLDRRYYDHTSYYRLIDVPEPGRNFSAKVAMEF
ncbi:MAG: TonB-dependent receptor [Bacteroidales bacterium]|nr:TonB-dependent receptor [Bacteroidales bacterium]